MDIGINFIIRTLDCDACLTSRNIKVKVKVKQSRYRPEVAQRVPGR